MDPTSGDAFKSSTVARFRKGRRTDKSDDMGRNEKRLRTGEGVGGKKEKGRRRKQEGLFPKNLD